MLGTVSTVLYVQVMRAGKGMAMATGNIKSRLYQGRDDALKVLRGVSIKDLALTCVLVMAFVMSAIGVVYSSHLCRQLFAEHAVLLGQNDQLQLEWAQLLLEQSAWSSPHRIESVAREELQMTLPAVEQIELVY